jgi:hypothetical protein
MGGGRLSFLGERVATLCCYAAVGCCAAAVAALLLWPPSPLLLCSVAGISCCWSVGGGRCQEINLFIYH